MELRSIEKEIWQSYFDFVSKTIKGQYAEIEVASLGVGDQIEESWVLLDGLSYEPESENLFVHMEALDHVIAKPLEVVVMENGGASIKSIAVKDADGSVQIINFRAPLLLGAGVSAGQGTASPGGDHP